MPAAPDQRPAEELERLAPPILIGLDTDQLIVLLRARIASHVYAGWGKSAHWSRENGLNPSEVAEILRKQRPVSKRVALRLGMRREPRFFPARRNLIG